MTTTTNRDKLIELIREVGGRYRETPVKLAGGGETHIYLDVKGILTNGERLRLAAEAMVEHLLSHQDVPSFGRITAIGGPTMGADVLAHAATMVYPAYTRNLSWFAVRDFAKTDHGLGRWIEGAELGPEDKVIITDDVASTGKSLVEAYERVVETGAQVLAIVPLVDRADKAEKRLRDAGITVPYLPVIRYPELGIEAL